MTLLIMHASTSIFLNVKKCVPKEWTIQPKPIRYQTSTKSISSTPALLSLRQTFPTVGGPILIVEIILAEARLPKTSPLRE